MKNLTEYIKELNESIIRISSKDKKEVEDIIRTCELEDKKTFTNKDIFGLADSYDEIYVSSGDDIDGRIAYALLVTMLEKYDNSDKKLYKFLKDGIVACDEYIKHPEEDYSVQDFIYDKVFTTLLKNARW